MRGIEVVDDDEIEIGARRHFPAAELAHGDDRTLPAADAAVARGEGVVRRVVQRADDHVGQACEGVAGLLRRRGAGQDARSDQEHVLLAEQPHAVEEVLVGARLFERTRQLGLQHLGVGQRAEEGGIDQRIHDLRMLRKDVGQPRRGAEQMRHQGDEVGVLVEQGEKRCAAVQAVEKAIERGDRRIGVLGAGEVVDQHRYEPGEMAARELPAQERGTPASQPRTASDTSTGWRNPISTSLSRVSRSLRSGGNTRPR